MLQVRVPNKAYETQYLYIKTVKIRRGIDVIVIGVAGHQCARPHPREGYNYYTTCYLGNITV